MADQMRPTPRNSVLGLFSDIVNLPLQYMSAPERTQQMQGTAQFLYGTGIPKTLERMSYGDSLFSGAGGLGGTTRMRPETAEALMNVAPFAPAAGRLASRAVRATEGMPVGMGIKSVGDDIFNLSKQEFLGKPRITKNANAADLKPIELTTLKNVEPQPFMGGKYQIKMNEDGAVVLDKGKPIASYNFGDTLVVDKPYRKSGLAQELVYEWRTTFPAPAVAKERTKASQAIQEKVWERIQNEKQSSPEQSPYPQQAALDLAQQRAALPVEQGGLGLPANNTAADRAKAMGFDTDLLHGTAKDFPAFDLSKAGTNTRQAGDELGIFSTSKPFLANDYAQIASRGGWANRTTPENAVVYPLVGNFQNPKKYETASQFYRDADAMAAEQNLGNWRRQLQGQGYDSVFVRPDLEEVVAFSPDQLRSRFAAFDPFRKDVATATAMGVALPDLLAQPVNRYELPQDTTPMYTDPFGNTIGSSIR